MRNLFDFLVKYSYWLLFLVLEGISLAMLVSHNSYHGSVFLSSANRVTGKVYEWESELTSYLSLKDANRQLVDDNVEMRLRIAALEKQLAARAAAGKRIAIAALCAGMTFSMAGCASPFANNKGGDKSGTEDLAGMMDEPDEVYVTTGEVAPPEDTGEEGQEGSTSQEDSNGNDVPEEIELTGDVAYIEEDVAP